MSMIMNTDTKVMVMVNNFKTIIILMTKNHDICMLIIMMMTDGMETMMIINVMMA